MANRRFEEKQSTWQLLQIVLTMLIEEEVNKENTRWVNKRFLLFFFIKTFLVENYSYSKNQSPRRSEPRSLIVENTIDPFTRYQLGPYTLKFKIKIHSINKFNKFKVKTIIISIPIRTIQFFVITLLKLYKKEHM